MIHVKWMPWCVAYSKYLINCVLKSVSHSRNPICTVLVILYMSIFPDWFSMRKWFSNYSFFIFITWRRQLNVFKNNNEIRSKGKLKIFKTVRISVHTVFISLFHVCLESWTVEESKEVEMPEQSRQGQKRQGCKRWMSTDTAQSPSPPRAPSDGPAALELHVDAQYSSQRPTLLPTSSQIIKLADNDVCPTWFHVKEILTHGVNGCLCKVPIIGYL